VRGTGLGLFPAESPCSHGASIARKVVEAPTYAKASAGRHGGKIWAESDGEGKGSTFSVVLPMI